MPRSLLRFAWPAAGLFLFLFLLLALGTIQAQAKQAEPKKDNDQREAAVVITATGKLALITVGEESYHVLQDGAGKTLYYLEAGPRWFYAAGAYPLTKYANQQVTVVGVVEQPKTGGSSGPNANASDTAKANAKAKPNKVKEAKPADAPTLEVHRINNETLRGAGKPPWAGGPKNVPNHPGAKGKLNGNGQGKTKGKANKPTTP